MKGYFLSLFRCLSLLMLSCTLQVGAASSETTPLVRLPGHIPSQAAKAFFLEKLDDTLDVPLTFILPLRNQMELEELVQSIYDPTDLEHYGKYLTSEEFVERFAPTQEDYDRVIAYAKTLGLTVNNTHSNRTLLNVVGQAETIEKAFNLHLNTFETPQGRKFYAPNDNPAVPKAIASIIKGVVGLDNLAVWRSFHQRRHRTEESHDSNRTSHAFPSGPQGGYAPDDLLTAYNLKEVPAKGTGQAIALFELAGYQASDINEYTDHFGLPRAKLKNVLVDGGSGSGIDLEVTLDIELALALAPESQIYVYEGPNSGQGVLDTYNRIATDNIAKQVSTSWGLAEDLTTPQQLQAENAIFLQMAAHGQTIYAAAGDSGAYDDPNKSSPVVDDPAAQPYVVGVGGTKLTVNPQTGAYASESCWDNGRGNGAGGGGVSTFWPIPSWQANIPGVFSTTHRNIPDVSLNADPNTGYSVYHNSEWTTVGGTSCAAPLWAAFTACVNQERVANQKDVLGFANPIIYAIAAGSSFATDFHDVTVGNNLYYPSKSGYDNATGWGTFNGANLFASLTDTSVTPPPPPPQLLPLLNITMTHNTPFYRGSVGTYQIEVSNDGNTSTSGVVTVALTLPSGLTYRSVSGGSGWTFHKNSLTFTQTKSLSPGSSYSVIKVNVDVKHGAPSLVTTTATVSGGGSVSDTVTNPTIIK